MDLDKYDGHTPGPWSLWRLQDSRYDSHWLDGPGSGKALPVVTPVNEGTQFEPDLRLEILNHADSLLIEDAPLILAEAKRLAAENAALKEKLSK